MRKPRLFTDDELRIIGIPFSELCHRLAVTCKPPISILIVWHDGGGQTKPVRVALKKHGKRPAFSRESGSRDDAYFVTLNPNASVGFKAMFHLADITGDRAVFEPGHKCRFALKEGHTIDWWRAGKKEEVMGPPGEPAGLDKASGRPIPLEIVSVDIAVV